MRTWGTRIMAWAGVACIDDRLPVRSCLLVITADAIAGSQIFSLLCRRITLGKSFLSTCFCVDGVELSSLAAARREEFGPLSLSSVTESLRGIKCDDVVPRCNDVGQKEPGRASPNRFSTSPPLLSDSPSHRASVDLSFRHLSREHPWTSASGICPASMLIRVSSFIH